MKTQRSFWPYGIVLAFVLFIGGTAALIVIACTHRTDLITADYYAEELQFQSRLDQLNRTASLGERLEVAYDGVQQNIRLALPSTIVSAETHGRIHLYRPSATDRDVMLPLQLDASGAQTIDAAALLPGLWKVRVQWTAHNRDYFADKSVMVKPGA